MPKPSRCRVTNSYVVIPSRNTRRYCFIHNRSKEMVWMVHGIHQRTVMDRLRIHHQTIRLHNRSNSLRNSQHHTRNTLVSTKQTPKQHRSKQVHTSHRFHTKHHKTHTHQQLNPSKYTQHTHTKHPKTASPSASRVAEKCFTFSGCRVTFHRLISFHHGSTNKTH